MKHLLAKASSMFVVSGLVKMAAGIAIIFWPIDGFTSLIYLFGVPAIVQGIIHMNTAVHNRSMFGYWWVLLLEGIVYTAAGLFALAFPGITPPSLMIIIAAAWSFSGFVMILLSIQLNREWVKGFELVLAGIISIVAGVYLVTHLNDNIYSILWIIVSYSFMIGILTIFFGVKAKAWRNRYFDDIME
jgi:uncharacterized membrane protein HdeD (DUF308 family)